MKGRTWTIALAAGAQAACTGAREPVQPDPASEVRVFESVEYRAETQVMESFPVQLRTRATVTNRAGRTAEVVFPDGCVVLLRAYRSPERSGPPAWDQAGAVGCTMALVEVALAPGEAREFSTGASARDILGDSLPDARYYFTAVLRPGGTEVEVAAGDAELAVPRGGDS